jgi:phosphatidylserine decarboxylase
MPFVAGASVVWLVLLAGAWWLQGAWWMPWAVWTPVTAWIPWFFRFPTRSGPRGRDVVLAPADGKVVGIISVEEPDYLEGPATRISIFMNVFDVHVNLYPVDGCIEYRVYRPGRFVNATLDKASEHNERMSLGIRGPRGRVLVRQIAGLVARRVVTDHHPGDRARQGERLGLIRFGSRVETFLPPEATVLVAAGERCVAGQTVMARWPA